MEKAKKERTAKGNKTVRFIVLQLIFVILGLTGFFSGTYAWFASSASASATAGSFQVVAPPEVGFELYYLDNFTDGESQTKPGNFNVLAHSFSGYYSEYSVASFVAVNFEGNAVTPRYYTENGTPITPKADAASCTQIGEGYIDNEGHLQVLSATSPERVFTLGYIRSPVNIQNLWPAYRLTYALKISSGAMTKFSLQSWSENTNPDILTDEDQVIRLSWATNIYGGAFNAASMAAGFALYHAALIRAENPLSDVFLYNEQSTVYGGGCDIATNPGTPGANEYTFVFFTIEFSNANTTFYERLSNGKYHKTTSGNSNCYQTLSFANMIFSLQ